VISFSAGAAILSALLMIVVGALIAVVMGFKSK